MGLVDNIKRKFQSDVKPAVSMPTTEIGRYESSIYSLNQFTNYNPDELIINKGWEIYKRMMLDDQVKAASMFKRSAVASRKWFFNVTDPEDEQQILMRDVQMAVIDKMETSMRDVFGNLLSALQWGFSVNEEIYKAIEFDNKAYWGIKAIKLRPAETIQFQIDVHGNVTEIEQGIYGGDTVKLPLQKVLYFVNRPDVNPVWGESDLKACHRDWWSKDNIIKFWNIHLERHGSGMWIAKVEGELSGPNKANLQNVLKNLSAATAVQVPSGMELDFEQPANTDGFEKAIIRADKAIAKSMLVPNMLGLSEQGGTGSFAQSKTQFKAFLWILDDIAERITEVLNESLFKQLAVINFGTDEFPKFQFEPMSDDEKLELSKAWGEAVKAGAVTKSDADEEFTRTLLGYPEKTEEDEPEPVEPAPAPDVIPNKPDADDQAADDDADPDIDDTPMPEADNEAFIARQDAEWQEHIHKEFAHKPWLKRINFADVEKLMDTNEEVLSAELNDILGREHFNIDKQVKKMSKQGKGTFGTVPFTDVRDFRFSPKAKADMNRAYKANLRKAYDEAEDQAKTELPKQFSSGTQANIEDVGTKFIASRAFKATGDQAARIESLVQNTLMNAIKYDWPLKTTIDELTTVLAPEMPEYETITTAKGLTYDRAINQAARLDTISRTIISETVNNSRQAFFQDPSLVGFVRAYQYSAILDDRTTEICTALNNKIRRDFQDRVPPNHMNCRSILVAVTVQDDWDGKSDRMPSVPPQQGFGSQ